MAQNNQNGLYIRESIDGVPVEPPAPKKARKASRKTSETVATALKSDP